MHNDPKTRTAGLTDTSHNPMWPEDQQLTVTDPNAYEVLDDTTAPQLLAILDGSDALYLLFDEPVEPAAGYDLGTAVTIVRSGQPVDGTATRLTANLLQWQPGSGVGGLVPGGAYTISGVHLTDLAGNAATAAATFTHLNPSTDMLLLAYQAPADSQPESQSAYGLTTLFQGRTWHGDLGMYYYRARWYLPEMGEFAERDPLGYRDSSNLVQGFSYDAYNYLDPTGRGAVVPGHETSGAKIPRETPEEKAQPNLTLPLLPATPEIEPSAPLNPPDIGLDAEKYVATDTSVVRQVLRLARYVTDFGTFALAEKIVDVAEKKHFSAGISTGANIAWPEAGIGGSVNLQVFFNEDYYYVGLFGTETWSNLSPEERGNVGSIGKVLAPMGASGFGGFISPFSVNVARTRKGTPNTPQQWAGFFNSWNVDFGVISGSVFWSTGTLTPFFAGMRGVEVGLGFGGGATYLRSYYHAWPVFGGLQDPASTIGIVRLFLNRFRKNGGH